jgi:hypothetical protein
MLTHLQTDLDLTLLHCIFIALWTIKWTITEANLVPDHMKKHLAEFKEVKKRLLEVDKKDETFRGCNCNVSI